MRNMEICFIVMNAAKRSQMHFLLPSPHCLFTSCRFVALYPSSYAPVFVFVPPGHGGIFLAFSWFSLALSCVISFRVHVERASRSMILCFPHVFDRASQTASFVDLLFPSCPSLLLGNGLVISISNYTHSFTCSLCRMPLSWCFINLFLDPFGYSLSKQQRLSTCTYQATKRKAK